MRRPGVFLVAMLLALTACSGNQRAQPEATPSTAAVAATPTAVATTSSTAVTAPAATLTPPPFKVRAAAETREEEWREIPGSASRECVDVAKFQQFARQVGRTERDLALELRSGEFVAGDFFEPGRARSSSPLNTPGDPSFELKVYWIGFARELQVPVITAVSLSEPSRPALRASSSAASNPNGFFTASGVPLPAHGRWRITAVSTDQWGCYDVEI